MSRIYLERPNSDLNMQRFYAMHVVQTIFGEWAWPDQEARCGTSGSFDTEEEAIAAGNRLRVTKEKRGYLLLSEF